MVGRGNTGPAPGVQDDWTEGISLKILAYSHDRYTIDISSRGCPESSQNPDITTL
jgi:hypothetical protein